MTRDKDPRADPHCPSCHGRGSVVHEKWAGFKVRVWCDCLDGYARRLANERLLRADALARAEEKQ